MHYDSMTRDTDEHTDGNEIFHVESFAKNSSMQHIAVE